MVSVGNKFLLIKAARKAISHYVLNKGESYRVYKSDKTYYILICYNSECKFRIRVSKSKKDRASIIKLDLHSYTPTTYYNSKPSYLI